MRSLRIVAFYAARPHYFPELLRQFRIWLGRKLLPRPVGRGSASAQRWAQARAVSPGEALRAITGEPAPALEALLPDVLAQALRRVAECPVQMGGGAIADVLYHLARHAGATRVVETGVAYGFSSLALLLAVRAAGGRLISVDMPYPGQTDGSFVGCAVPPDLHACWTLLRYPDSIGLPRALRAFGGEIDLFHYDSDKGYEGRVSAFRQVWRALRKGGLLICDDIGDNTAFRDFAEHVGEEPIVLRGPGTGGSGVRFVGVLAKAAAAQGARESSE